MRAQGLCRLGRDAEIKYLQNGDAVANLSLAFDFGKRGADGNRPTQWIDASLWGKRAEALSPYLLKGSQVVAYLEDVHIENYVGKNGPSSKLVGRVVDIELVSNKGARDQAPAEHEAPKRTSAEFDKLDDDIPF